MTIDEAIKTALKYEGRIAAIYRDAMDQSQDPIGRKVFKTLNEDELGHVRCLKEELNALQKSGRLMSIKLTTIIPPADKIAAAAKAFRGKASSPMPETEISLLRRALELEVETAGFYRKLAEELPAEDRELFERFVRIEEGHIAIVQAEIDYLSKTGFWFDVPEFRLEAG
ncbi:MAG: ferritin family protein [Acidobacteria bacterium]|nr:ferritin family protein [Acidobacteriota bacterium]